MFSKALVCCYCDIHTGGGGATLARIAAFALHHADFCVSILSHSKRTPSVETIEGLSFKYHFVESGLLWRFPLLVRERQLAKFLKNNFDPPDVVLPVSPFYVNAVKKAWPNAPIIYLFPCLLWRCLPHTFVSGKKSFSRRLNHWLIGRSERSALSNSDKIIIQGPSVVEDILDFHHIDPSKFVVVPTGVSDLSSNVKRPRLDVRKQLDTPNFARVLLSVGSIDNNKNQISVIRAICDERCNDLWLWIVGNGPQLEEAMDTARNLGMSSRVRFLGYRSDMADIYSAADVFVHSAIYDNFPNVYLEAMVSGLPLVGPRGEFPNVVSPLDRMIQEGVHGFTFSLLDPQGLADALAKIADMSTHELFKIGQSARDLALNQYSWTKFSTTLLDTVQSLGGNKLRQL